VNAKTLVAVAMMVMCGSSFAGEKWKEDHPRRAQVNSRLDNQNRRIKEGVQSGKLSRKQANQLHAEDHAIRQEERAMAAQHGGHITKSEQRELNHQENQVSRQIYEEKH
jgi:hypothetical protein